MNANKSEAHTQSATIFTQGAVDMTYDMINNAFQLHLVRIFRKVVMWVNDTRQMTVDDAMIQLIKYGTNATNTGQFDEEAAAQHLCAVVVTYFRMLMNRNMSAKDLLQNILLMIAPVKDSMVRGEGLRLKLDNMFPKLFAGKGITTTQRNTAMRALYAAHGMAIRFHPLDAKAGFVKGLFSKQAGDSSFFSVHAPLCVMLVDFAFTENNNIFAYKHITLKAPTPGQVVDNPGSVEKIMALVDNTAIQTALYKRCVDKLFHGTVRDVQTALETVSTGPDADPTIPLLRHAGRMVYNAIMATDQFQALNIDTRMYYSQSSAKVQRAFEQVRQTKNSHRVRVGRFETDGREDVAKLNTRIRDLNVLNSIQ